MNIIEYIVTLDNWKKEKLFRSYTICNNKLILKDVDIKCTITKYKNLKSINQINAICKETLKIRAGAIPEQYKTKEIILKADKQIRLYIKWEFIFLFIWFILLILYTFKVNYSSVLLFLCFIVIVIILLTIYTYITVINMLELIKY